jgi:hypothetical protein
MATFSVCSRQGLLDQRLKRFFEAVARRLQLARVFKRKNTMQKPSNQNTDNRRSTYQLLIDSEEKQRGAFESVAYLALSMALSAAMWQFSHQPVTFTGLGVATAASAAVESSSIRA